MKQDIDLFRKIMIKIEDSNEPETELKIEGYSDKLVFYHCDCLYKAGYITSLSCDNGDSRTLEFKVGQLTLEGAKFLDTIREDNTWKKFKKYLSDNNIVISSLLSFIEFTANFCK